MSEIDKFYTPAFISKRMIKVAGTIDAKIIADFASGDGSLLLSASNKWKKASFYANDICKSTAVMAKINIDNCISSNIDFLNRDKFSKNKVLRSIIGKCDLILLNPPYSYRGQYCTTIEGCDQKLTCPKSLVFIINSLPFLAQNGKIIALMPEGAIRGERSREAIAFIEKGYELKVLEEFSANSFSDCYAKTVIISVSSKKIKNKSAIKSYKKSSFKITRGNTSMFKVGKQDDNKIPIIHSTSLTKNGIVLNGNNGIGISHIISSPTVLIQRVGKMQKHKVVLYTEAGKASLSDCLFAIEVDDEDEGKNVVGYIHNNWNLFINEYIGTCAQFITIERLHNFLCQIPRLPNEQRSIST